MSLASDSKDKSEKESKETPIKKSTRPISAMKRTVTDSRKSFDKGDAESLITSNNYFNSKSNNQIDLNLNSVLKPEQTTIDPALLESARQFLNKGNNGGAIKDVAEPPSPVLQRRTFSLAPVKSKEDVVSSIETMISEVLQNRVINTNDRTSSVSYFNTVSAFSTVKQPQSNDIIDNVGTSSVYSLQNSQSNASLSTNGAQSNLQTSFISNSSNKQVTFAVSENVSKK